MNIGWLPNTALTVVSTVAGTAATVAGIKRGLVYRVVATAAVNIQVTNGAATASTGLYIPANIECFFVFGYGDSSAGAVDPIVSVIGTATVYFTPVTRVVAG